MLKPLAIAAVLFSLSGAGMAQDSFVPPVTTTDPGYLFPINMYQLERDRSIS